MPHLPEVMIDAMEKLLPSKFFDAEVRATTVINAEILEITFAANLSKINFQAGYAVMLRIGSKDLRHYTVSAFDSASGLFKILFHLHGNGPGSLLAARLKPGDPVKMAVPGGRKMFVPESSHHFFFGDETSLSLIQIFTEEICKCKTSYNGIVELRPQNRQVTDQLKLNLATVTSSTDDPASKAIEYLKELVRDPEFGIKNYVFYVTGNVKSVHAFRKALKALEVQLKNIKFQGYWAEGSVGL